MLDIPTAALCPQFRTYAIRNGLFLFPLKPNSKQPYKGGSWQEYSSNDPAAWDAWAQQYPNCNWACDLSKSGLFGIGPDSNVVGRDAAWAEYDRLCREWGFPTPPPAPQVESARGGWHVYFRKPLDCPKLSQDKAADCVDVRAEGYFVVAGSVFEGGQYRTMSPLPDPHESTLAQITALQARGSRTKSAGVAPALDCFNIDEVREWIDRKIPGWKEDDPKKNPNPWNNQGEWILFCKALKLHFPNDDGLSLAMRITHSGHGTLVDRWKNEKDFTPVYFEGARTLHYHLDGDVCWIFRKALNELKNTTQPIAPPPSGEPQSVIQAQPFVWIEPSKIPMRQWVYGRRLLRKQVSGTIANSGAGKSTLSIADALAMVTGRKLLHEQPHGKYRVWIYNLEDPREELQRRVTAAMQRHGIRPEDVEGRLFLNSGRDKSFHLADMTRWGVHIWEDVIAELQETIITNKVDVLILDPFVSTHGVPESDNGAIDQVAKALAALADRTNCAIDVVHHSRKTGGADVTAEDARGASALVAAVRSARALNIMSEGDAITANVDNRCRVDDAKANFARRAAVVDWIHLLGTPLLNGPDGTFGDDVGVAMAWSWPSPTEGIGQQQILAAQAALREDGPWRENSQANAWAGIPIAAALALDISEPVVKVKIKELIKRWIQAGFLKSVPGKDERRKSVIFIEAGAPPSSPISGQ